ncbi:MAG: vitamin K epoxide reductase family protein [Simkania sp.]|nr:vitamin K epoxide reductase family protein [Simkania sp.]
MEIRVKNFALPLWAPFALIFLGFWLLAAPTTFGFAGSCLGNSDIACGIVLIFLGWTLRNNFNLWIPWTISLIGVWLQLAPLVLRIPQATGYLNDTFTGVMTILCSLLIATPREAKGEDVPKGWSYNPSCYAQRLPVILLTGLCWFMARYLAAYQLGFITTIWDPFFKHGTVDVITSAISKSLPIPDAGLGAFAYTMECLLGCHGGGSRWRTAPWLVISFGILVIPVGLISTLLIILQPLIVHAWCTLCLVIGLAMLVMITLTIDEVAASLQLLKRGHRSGLSVWNLLWNGWPSEKERLDPRSVPLQASFVRLFKAFSYGCGIPWNLACSALLGAGLMALPSWFHLPSILANIDHVFGALTVVISVISMAEIIRKIRFTLWLFAAVTTIIALITSQGVELVMHVSIGILLVLLAIRKGRIKESYG